MLAMIGAFLGWPLMLLADDRVSGRFDHRRRPDRHGRGTMKYALPFGTFWRSARRSRPPSGNRFSIGISGSGGDRFPVCVR
jgi:hypothetical protein